MPEAHGDYDESELLREEYKGPTFHDCRTVVEALIIELPSKAQSLINELDPEPDTITAFMVPTGLPTQIRDTEKLEQSDRKDIGCTRACLAAFCGNYVDVAIPGIKR